MDGLLTFSQSMFVSRKNKQTTTEKTEEKCMIDREAQSQMCMLIGGQENEHTLTTSIL